MYIVTAHRIYAVRLSVNNVLIVEEEFISSHQLRLTSAQFVGNDTVLEDVRKL